MILNDRQIIDLAQQGVIQPFASSQVRKVSGAPAISFGLSCYGYDIRLSPDEFLVPNASFQGESIDPKNLSLNAFEQVELKKSTRGIYFEIPPHSFGLGKSLERFCMPSDVTTIAVSKSTYARAGMQVLVTPFEACMSDDTEVLASTGWKLLKDVFIGEQVLTLNPKTNQAEYQPVQDFHSYYYNGELLHFHGKMIDQLVTPRHKMWTAKRARRKALACGGQGTSKKEFLNSWEWGFEFASEIFDKWNYYLSRDVKWQGEVAYGDLVSIGKYKIPVAHWCKFIGAWMGDGSTYDAGKGNYVIKLAVVSKKKKRDYFRDLLTVMGVNFCESEYGFHFQDKALHLYLTPYKKAKNKHLPLVIKGLPPRLLDHVIEGMMMSDGNIESSTYVSSSKKLIDDFQEICIKAGHYATCWERTEYSSFTNGVHTQYKCRYSMANKTPSKMRPGKNFKKVPYAGMVYDITVPHHVFLSRRNGRASWTGNSWRGTPTLEFANHWHLPLRIYANEGVLQLLFFRGELPQVPYGNRPCGGKYQNQENKVVLPRI